MHSSVRVLTLSFAVGLALAAGTRPARACAPAPPPRQPVSIIGEEALIVWDEATHTEHFIRSANFRSSAASFGFLVPTPSKPDVAEANADVFDTLSYIVAPPPPQYSSSGSSGGCGCFGFGGAARMGAAPAPPPVRVLAETRVAGLDAVVLEADSASALGDWLAARGFELRDALKRWLAPYIEQKWKITAFRYTRPGAEEDASAAPAQFASSAVRLSFTTDAPIYPYREPDDTAEEVGRELHVFLLSSRPELGFFTPSNAPWQVAHSFSQGVTGSRERLAGSLPGVVLPASLWLDQFDDPASLREPSDVVFHPAVDAGAPPASGHGPAHARSSIPVPFAVPLVLGGVWWSRVRGRRRRPRLTGGASR